MDQQSGTDRFEPVTVCVKLIKVLEQEIQEGMTAIARNRLADFEESLWRQEAICVKLKRSIGTIRPGILNTGSYGQLREAASLLKTRSQIYEKLVAQSSRSSAILQHLCSLYRNAARYPGRAIYGSISREA
jgi:hypothetical protein